MDIIVTPACTGLGLDCERTRLAIISAEEIEQVDTAIDTDIRIVECRRTVDTAFPVRSIDTEQRLDTDGKRRRNLLVKSQTHNRAHRLEKRVMAHRSCHTAVDADRPVIEKRLFLDGLSRGGQNDSRSGC